MALTTYAELQTEILNWSTRSVLSASVPDFVVLTEAIFNYGDGDPVNDPTNYIAPLRNRDMETSGTVTISSGSGSLPSGFLEPIRAYTSTRILNYVTPVWYTENYPSGQSTDPAYYTILGSTAYSGATFTLDYYTKIVALASTSPNWLLTAVPNAYLHGGLYHLYLYDKDGERAAIHRGLMMNALAGVRETNVFSKALMPQRRSGMTAW